MKVKDIFTFGMFCILLAFVILLTGQIANSINQMVNTKWCDYVKTHDASMFAHLGLTNQEAHDLIENAMKTGVHSQEDLVKAMSMTKKGSWLSQYVTYQGYGRYVVTVNGIERTTEDLADSIINAIEDKKTWFGRFAYKIIQKQKYSKDYTDIKI